MKRASEWDEGSRFHALAVRSDWLHYSRVSAADRCKMIDELLAKDLPVLEPLVGSQMVWRTETTRRGTTIHFALVKLSADHLMKVRASSVAAEAHHERCKARQDAEDAAAAEHEAALAQRPLTAQPKVEGFWDSARIHAWRNEAFCSFLGESMRLEPIETLPPTEPATPTDESESMAADRARERARVAQESAVKAVDSANRAIQYAQRAKQTAQETIRHGRRIGSQRLPSPDSVTSALSLDGHG